MISIQVIKSLSAAELERRIYALADDAGAFSIPQVRAITEKLMAEPGVNPEIERLRDQLSRAQNDIDEIESELETLGD